MTAQDELRLVVNQYVDRRLAPRRGSLVVRIAVASNQSHLTSCSEKNARISDRSYSVFTDLEMQSFAPNSRHLLAVSGHRLGGEGHNRQTAEPLVFADGSDGLVAPCPAS